MSADPTTPADTRETSCQPMSAYRPVAADTDAPLPVTVDLDALLDAIFEAFRAHSSPTIDYGDAHSARGQSGLIVWRSSYPFIREAIRQALGASIRPPRNPPL